MTLADTTSQITTSASAMATLLSQVGNLLRAIAKFRRGSYPTTEYENLRLDIVWDIRDPKGHQAVLNRRQRVQFLSPDTGVVRDLVWGDGNQVVRYTTRGAKRVFERPEGSRRALMLGIDHRPMKGERTTITSRRVIERGFLDSSEYCEAVVERPTQYLGLTILFPQNRPPHSAHLVTSDPTEPTQKLSLRHDSNGRPFLKWSSRSPTQERLYSMRWSW